MTAETLPPPIKSDVAAQGARALKLSKIDQTYDRIADDITAEARAALNRIDVDFWQVIADALGDADVTPGGVLTGPVVAVTLAAHYIVSAVRWREQARQQVTRRYLPLLADVEMARLIDRNPYDFDAPALDNYGIEVGL